MRICFAGICFLLTFALFAQAAEDQWFNSNGVQIRYIVQGSGEPVLLIHGYTQSVETNWIDTGVFQNLAKDHRVVAFDLRGHGKSGKPHDPSAYAGEMVQDAVRLLDHLNIPRAHIVGYSLGAIITAKLLTTNADRFLSATLGAHAGYRNWRPEYDQGAQRTALELEGDVPFRSLVIAMTPSDEPKRSEDDIRSRSNALATANDLRALAAYNRGGSGELNSTDTEVSAIKVPVLGIIGSLDNVRSMKQLQTILPSLKLVVIEGATHAGDRSAARRPEFVSAIREFVGAHDQPSQ